MKSILQNFSLERDWHTIDANCSNNVKVTSPRIPTLSQAEIIDPIKVKYTLSETRALQLPSF